MADSSEFMDNLQKFVEAFEGKRMDVYLDPVGKPTTGIGHLVLPSDNLVVGDCIDDQRVSDFFDQDIQIALDAIADYVDVPLGDNQKTALASFVFNVGVGNFKGSTMLKKLNAGDYSGASAEFPRWTKSSGKTLPGLVTRREDERTLFETPDK